MTNAVVQRTGLALAHFARTAALLLLVATLGIASAAAQDAAAEASADQTVIDYLSALDAAKLDQLFKHIGIAPTSEFLDCLCPTDHGFHYAGTEGQPCRRTGPLGGVEGTGLDMGRARSCAAAYPLADGRSVLDAVTDAATRPAAEAAARVCQTFVADWSGRRAALRARIENARDALAAWMARKLASEDVYRGKSWLWSALWAAFNAPFPQRDQGFKYDPGPLGANLNQDMGAYRCLGEMFQRCQAAMSGVAGASGTPDAKAQSAMGSFADALAAETRERAAAAFEAAIELKQQLAANPGELRISAEANRESGYASTCRAAADDLERIGAGKPNPYSDDADTDTSPAQFPRG